MGTLEHGTWTYSADPSQSTLDALRFYMGDTDESDKQFSDEELEYLLTVNADDPQQAAVDGLSRLISKFSRAVDKQVGDLRISYSQRVDQYTAVRDDLVSRGGGNVAPIPYAGGISKLDFQARRANTDAIPPVFDIGQFDALPGYWYDNMLDPRDPTLDP